jgi:hypothetical protein
MKYIALVLSILLYPSFSLADKEPPVVWGLIGGSSTGFVSAGYHLFNEQRDNDDFFGLHLPRYGSSLNRLQIGNGVGISINSVVGFTESYSFITVGFEPTSGRVVLNTNSNIESYFEWMPALSLGPKFTLLGVDVSIHGRYGFAVGDMGLVGLSPEFTSSYGWAAYLNTRLISIAAESTYIGSGSLIKSLDVKSGFFIIRYEDTTSIRNEQSLMLLLSF